jgi:predicted amidohydrolase YtcJ
MKLASTVFVLATLVTVAAQNLPAPPRADTIFLSGNIYIGVVDASSFHAIRRAEAMAVRDGRVQAVGRDDEIRKLKGPSTEVINLGGHFVMPGFNDAHMHLANAGFRRLTVDLMGVKSLTEFRDRIRARVQDAAPDEWIVGGGWDQTLWPVKELPSRWDIDEVTTDHPVFLATRGRTHRRSQHPRHAVGEPHGGQQSSGGRQNRSRYHGPGHRHLARNRTPGGHCGHSQAQPRQTPAGH